MQALLRHKLILTLPLLVHLMTAKRKWMVSESVIETPVGIVAVWIREQSKKDNSFGVLKRWVEVIMMCIHPARDVTRKEVMIQIDVDGERFNSIERRFSTR